MKLYTEKLKNEVEEKRNILMMEVNRLNYVIHLMKTEPKAYSDSSLISVVKDINNTLEDFINSKIEFTDEYFKEDYFNN